MSDIEPAARRASTLAVPKAAPEYARLRAEATELREQFKAGIIRKPQEQTEQSGESPRRAREPKSAGAIPQARDVGQLQTLKLEQPLPEHDNYFVKHILTPYLSNVYFGLIAR